MPQNLALNRDDVTLSVRLLRAMREAILDGVLEPGQHLSERALHDMFGVSRSLVREAIKALVAEDLITHIPHKGPMVTQLDRKSAQDLYRVRGAIEGLACAEFCHNAAPEQHRDLEEITARLARLVAENASEQAMVEAKNEFYRCLFAGSQNQLIGKIFTQLNNRVILLRRRSLSRRGRLPQMIVEIEAIVAAIGQRDANAARRLAEAHVAAAAQAADESFTHINTQT
jgi:DNA-binding GntR family transcriptional regulator